MSSATLTLNSKNYGAWSLRGWLICKLAGLDFVEESVGPDDEASRAELLLLSPSFLVPRLRVGDLAISDTLAIAEYLHETRPDAGLLPSDQASRFHCRSISGEMHGGFANLRSALPMNVRAQYRGFKVWAGARGDIERILAIWDDCLSRYGGPYLFGSAPTLADAMFAPVCLRFRTYDVSLEGATARYTATLLDHPYLREWIAAAELEVDQVEELDVEF